MLPDSNGSVTGAGFVLLLLSEEHPDITAATTRPETSIVVTKVLLFIRASDSARPALRPGRRAPPSMKHPNHRTRQPIARDPAGRFAHGPGPPAGCEPRAFS